MPDDAEMVVQALGFRVQGFGVVDWGFGFRG